MSSPSANPSDDAASDRELVRKLGRAGGAFFGRFDSLRPGQRLAIGPVLEGRNVLIAASTASGKTEAILAPLVARLQRNDSSVRRIHLLIVTPTRALVNDMLRRLEGPLAQLGWACGAQTSDHRDRERQPHVLITTPESFDSTLIAGFEKDAMHKPVDHWLSDVHAVFLDEAHLYYGTPRGDQVRFLLNRLRRVKARYRPDHSPLQLCGASATAGDETRVASWLLGGDSIVVRAAERRIVQYLDRSGNWTVCEGDDPPETLLATLPPGSDHHDLAELIERQRETHRLRKWLVFVPSRRVCDHLTLSLKEALGPRLGLWVGAHHSSLPRAQREKAEHRFIRDRDGVLVATSTLEVGVDIGDVDVVALVGCPSSASSLLQRIGRGNRRERDRTRLVTLPRNIQEARGLVGILRSAVSGALPSMPAPRFWAVFVQQIFAFVAQAHGQGRSKESLVGLASETWPVGDTAARATALLDQLVADGALVLRRGRLHLADATVESYGAGGALFANFDSGGLTTPVVDQLTGEIFANISLRNLDSTDLVIAGRRHRITASVDGRVEVGRSPSREITGAGEASNYSARRMPVTSEFAAALRDGCGFAQCDAPLLASEGRMLWFHFGGELWERLMRHGPHQSYFHRVVLPGIALELAVTADEFRAVRFSTHLLQASFHAAHLALGPVVELGRFKHHLTGPHLRQAMLDAIHLPALSEWASMRDSSLLPAADSRRSALLGLLSP